MRALLLFAVMWMSPLFGAYAAFDDIQLLQPSWLHVQGPLSGKVLYRITIQDLDQITVTMRSFDGQAHTLAMSLPHYQRDAKPISLMVPATDELSVQVPVTHLDQGLYRAVLQVAPRADALRSPPRSTTPMMACYARLPARDAQVNPLAIAYTISVRDGQLDLHVRNMTSDIVHTDVTIIGVNVTIPRLHLLPGTTSEVLLAAPDYAYPLHETLLMVHDVVIGEHDSTTRRLTDVKVADPTPVPYGWMPVTPLTASATRALLNVRSLIWRRDGDQLLIRNLSMDTVTLALIIGQNQTPIALTIAAQAEQRLSLPATTLPQPFVGANITAIADKPVTASALVSAPVAIPDYALPVVLRWPDKRFNPLSLVVSVAANPGASEASVTFINTTASAVHGEVSLGSFQRADATVPRLHVAAGQKTTLIIPITRYDVRLLLARVRIWNVRVGEDVGDVWVTKP